LTLHSAQYRNAVSPRPIGQQMLNGLWTARFEALGKSGSGVSRRRVEHGGRQLWKI
jgi:hypothetical protein